MARLIDANKAYEIARDSGCHNDFAMSLADLTSLREVLEDCPTVDAVEVVHGRWQFLDIDGWWFDECSVCGNTTPNRDGSPPDWNFCPNCGAKMDGDGGMANKCENCTEKCPQAEMAHQAALGRMYATKEFTALLKKVESGKMVEVVRCKDYKHCYKSSGSSTGYRCKVWSIYDTDCEVTQEHYCSHGERKDK